MFHFVTIAITQTEKRDINWYFIQIEFIYPHHFAQLGCHNRIQLLCEDAQKILL